MEFSDIMTFVSGGERYYTMMYEVVVGEDHRVDFRPMRFCPNCGVRFKEDDDGSE